MKPVHTVYIFVILAAVTFVPVAQAQSHQSETTPYDSEVFWQLATKQVVNSLESEHAHVRGQTLKNAIVFSTLYRDRIDLSAAVDPIARVAKNDGIGENRRLALAALKAIGSFRAKHHLAALKGIEDGEYRLLVAAVINEYQTKPNAL